ncbi:DUF4779 domain-containing protein [Saccharomonospora azurea]|uniref:Uncharacterized protein n=1 Tax=Saccharomonospora azurea NA-128 TaxID=882081 RepID=H8G8K4_9PSEU|nr:DUF4779 domain-containing protein [Saccharomonospora azurea]EHY87438.1 hypothetical protein SacazDRAFT_00471 [Saccharomonospora azurea NA-128]
MGLTGWLLRHTPPRPLVTATPGGTAARLAVERVLRERGWHEAASPAEANLLLIAGPLDDDLGPYVEAVWAQLPRPRARAQIDSAAAAPSAVNEVVATLRDTGLQRHQADDAPPEGHDIGHEQQGHQNHESHEDGGHEDNEAGADNGHQHAGHQHENESQNKDENGDGGHQHHDMGHDMGGMDMPGNVAMADRGEDRDGLTLDRVHLPLGPVLPNWPAGLVVHSTLQGDTIQDATVETVGCGRDPYLHPFWTGDTYLMAARRLDSCARLLSVAGWADAAATARRFRDEILPGGWSVRPENIAPMLSAWARRVRRSRVLRWSLTGVGVTPDVPSTPPGLRGDTLARLYRWLDDAERALTGTVTPSDEDDRAREARWTLDALPGLLTGTEFALARLLVASLDPDLDTVTAEVAHG